MDKDIKGLLLMHHISISDISYTKLLKSRITQSSIQFPWTLYIFTEISITIFTELKKNHKKLYNAFN